MKTKVYSVLDTKAESFGTPFFMPNRAMAQRAFNDLAHDDKTLVNKHPSDFMLYEIGDYEDENGELTPCKPINLGLPEQQKVSEAMELFDLSKIQNSVVKTKVQ